MRGKGRGLARRALAVLAGVVLLNLLLYPAAMLARRLFPSVGDEESSVIELVTIMDGRELESRASGFRGGALTTVLGGSRLDLTRATLETGGAFLLVRCVLGGVEVVVPHDWRVEYSGNVYAGGIEHRGPTDTSGPLLTVQATVALGGVAIEHAPPPA